MVEVISSEGNDRIKYLKKLYKRRNRKNEGKYVLEGARIIQEALQARAGFESLYLSASFAESTEGQGITTLLNKPEIVTLVDDKLLKSLADTSNPQGVIAIVQEPGCPEEVFIHKKGTILVLDRLQDPGNMGTIIRTALAAGVKGIITLKGSVDIYNLKVLRSTMGAIFNLPVMTDVDLEQFKEILSRQRNSCQVISADLSGDCYYYQANYADNIFLIIGNEANGIRKELLQLSDLTVKIPIIGEIDSLNAAIATGIILYKIAEREMEYIF